MIECFVSYYRTDYPECRSCWEDDFDIIQLQKSRDCFTSLNDDCETRKPDCNWSKCRSCHCTCLTEPCPLQKRVLQYRCSIKPLTESEIEFFEQKSGIKDNPNYVLHRGFTLDSLPERYEHYEALDEFRRESKRKIDVLYESPCPVIAKLKECINIAEKIQGRRRVVFDESTERFVPEEYIAAAETPPVESTPAAYPCQVQALTGESFIAPPIFSAASGKPMDAEKAYYQSKSIPLAEAPPDDVNIKNTEALFEANYMAGLALKYAGKNDEWHFISMTKYNWTGWAEIADKEEADSITNGNKKRTPKQMDALQEKIRRSVEAHREKFGIKRPS